MNENVRMGMAVLGGYVLGRTKKGGAAIRLALWVSGVNPREAAREGIGRAVRSPEVTKLASEITNPLTAALRAAAISAVESRVTGMADSLAQRSAGLKGVAASEEKPGEEEPGGEKSGAEKSGAEKSDAEKSDADEEKSGEQGAGEQGQSDRSGGSRPDGSSNGNEAEKGEQERSTSGDRATGAGRRAPQRVAGTTG